MLLVDYIDPLDLPAIIVWLDWQIYANTGAFIAAIFANILYFKFHKEAAQYPVWVKIIGILIGGTGGFMTYAYLRYGIGVG